MGGLVAVSSRDGTLKGYVVNNDYDSYGNDASLGVGPCLMPGFLSVVRDIGLKEPYTGTIALQSGEIGDDLAYYYTYSEQVPSLVALGVKFNSDASVKSAAGMIIQLMPGAAEETIVKIENRLRAAGSVSKLIEKFRTPEAILDYMLPGGNPEITAEKDISYKCGCSRNGMLRGVISLGREDLEKITSEQQEIEAVCHFCKAKYRFSSDDVMALLENQ